mmetsp:Transcript_80786/g.147979  ORF Transcript_80786/g.147979 Transcript_80786/m.147979 type:complete len:883 (-) Transcript_80786:104-2752(-)
MHSTMGQENESGTLPTQNPPVEVVAFLHKLDSLLTTHHSLACAHIFQAAADATDTFKDLHAAWEACQDKGDLSLILETWPNYFELRSLGAEEGVTFSAKALRDHFYKAVLSFLQTMPNKSSPISTVTNLKAGGSEEVTFAWKAFKEQSGENELRFSEVLKQRPDLFEINCEFSKPQVPILSLAEARAEERRQAFYDSVLGFFEQFLQRAETGRASVLLSKLVSTTDGEDGNDAVAQAWQDVKKMNKTGSRKLLQVLQARSDLFEVTSKFGLEAVGLTTQALQDLLCKAVEDFLEQIPEREMRIARLFHVKTEGNRNIRAIWKTLLNQPQPKSRQPDAIPLFRSRPTLFQIEGDCISLCRQATIVEDEVDDVAKESPDEESEADLESHDFAEESNDLERPEDRVTKTAKPGTNDAQSCELLQDHSDKEMEATTQIQDCGRIRSKMFQGDLRLAEHEQQCCDQNKKRAAGYDYQVEIADSVLAGACGSAGPTAEEQQLLQVASIDRCPNVDVQTGNPVSVPPPSDSLHFLPPPGLSLSHPGVATAPSADAGVPDSKEQCERPEKSTMNVFPVVSNTQQEILAKLERQLETVQLECKSLQNQKKKAENRLKSLHFHTLNITDDNERLKNENAHLKESLQRLEAKQIRDQQLHEGFKAKLRNFTYSASHLPQQWLSVYPVPDSTGSSGEFDGETCVDLLGSITDFETQLQPQWLSMDPGARLAEPPAPLHEVVKNPGQALLQVLTAKIPEEEWGTDDECCARMEEREARDSCADQFNNETFGQVWEQDEEGSQRTDWSLAVKPRMDATKTQIKLQKMLSVASGRSFHKLSEAMDYLARSSLSQENVEKLCKKVTQISGLRCASKAEMQGVLNKVNIAANSAKHVDF